MPRLADAQYGKANIRVCKVLRDEKTSKHTVIELTVTVLLKGDLDASYTNADNSGVVATDSMKNTVYILAKQNPVTPPELFASIVANHFVHTYAHIHDATVDVVHHRWTRLNVNGEPHPHSFLRDSEETRNAQAKASASLGISVQSAIAKLHVLKSTGSAFHGFIRDEYTTLPEVSDRILSTEVDCSWRWAMFKDPKEVESAANDFDAAWDAARTVTLNTFAIENSASVQNTMYKICQQILALVPGVETVDYSLPNKHYFETDLSWHNGLQNTGENAEVYLPQSDPNGLIQCSVTR